MNTILSRRIELVTVVVLLVAIIGLHAMVFHLGGGLWRDEANSAELASQSLSSGVYNNLMYDSFPPGSTVIFHFWNLFAGSDQGFRFLGFIIGMGIIAALVLNSRMLGAGLPLVSLAL